MYIYYFSISGRNSTKTILWQGRTQVRLSLIQNLAIDFAYILVYLDILTMEVSQT
jgi:hypothetical protein